MSRTKLVTVVTFLLGITVVIGGPGLVDAADQGILDATFGDGGKVVIPFDLVVGGSDYAEAVAVQRDGKIVAVGRAEKPGSESDFAVVRLTVDGDLDPTFGTGGKTLVAFDLAISNNDWATAVAIQPDGAIVVAGPVEESGGNYEFGVARLDADGELDPTFGVGGRTTVAFDLGGELDDFPEDIAIQGDGKIVVAGGVDGSAGNRDFGIVRLTSSGARDTGFGVNGIRVVLFDLGGSKSDVAYGVAVQPTGEILLAGSVEVDFCCNSDMGVVRLNENSTNDLTFGTNGKARVAFDLGGGGFDPAFDVALQDDGKILLAGGAMTSGSGWDFAVARLGTDGVLDDSFSEDGKVVGGFDLGGSMHDAVYGVSVEQDGRVVVAGRVDGPNGNADFGVARLQANGTIDTTFGGSGTMTVAFDLGDESDYAYGLAVPSTGGIFIVGMVQAAAGGTDFGIAKVHGSTVFGDGFETGDTIVWSRTVP